MIGSGFPAPSSAYFEGDHRAACEERCIGRAVSHTKDEVSHHVLFESVAFGDSRRWSGPPRSRDHDAGPAHRAVPDGRRSWASPARGLWSALFGLARDPLGYLLDAQRRSGDVVKLSLAHRSFVLVSHPDGVRRVLVDNAGNYDKLTPTFEKIRGIVGSSLTAEGDAWLERRRAAQPGFLENRVAELGPILADSTHRLIEQWRRTAPGSPSIWDQP